VYIDYVRRFRSSSYRLLVKLTIHYKHIVHFFSKVGKMNNDVVQQCFSNFKRRDKFKRLCNDYGFIVHGSSLAYRPYRACDKFCLQFL